MSKIKHFSVLSNLLSADDPRYQKWLKSLKKRPSPWNKWKTKETDKRVKKISDTMRNKGIDNFVNYREKLYESGKWVKNYPAFERSIELATLIGLVLGDGNIYRFPRTEKLSVSLGTDKPDLIIFTELLVEFVFKKKPTTLPYPYGAKAVRVTLYQKQISDRLGIESGKRRYSKHGIPQWIWENKNLLKACLKGLYEAEGSLSIHLPTCTYNFAFHNLNKKLLNDVHKALLRFGLHPEVRTNAIRLRKKNEVKYFKEFIRFRQY